MLGSLGGLLAAAAGPIAKRVLAALGVGLVTFVGVSSAFNALIAQAKNAYYGGIGADVALYLAMGGFNTALSIIVGAMTASISLIALKKLAVI